VTSVDVKTPAGGTAGKVDLPADIFDVQVNIPLIHQVVTAQLAAARQGTHQAKRRGEVSGSGKKPFKQKGTGRARQGSIRAPQYRGGGVVHGPKPRDYEQRTPKKMKAAALRGALSDRARNGQVHVVSELVVGEVPSTKGALAALAAVTDSANVLVVLASSEVVSAISLRNVTTVNVTEVGQLTTYDVLVADDIVFSKAALEALVAGPARGKSAKAVASSNEVGA
jgi:large subunit ribosomal protein L4